MAGRPMLEEFAGEASEILETWAKELYELDTRRGQEPEPDRLNAVFRAAHSLKGLSAMFGQERMAALAHHAEDVLDALRLGKVALTDRLLDTLVETLDTLQALLSEAVTGTLGGAAERADGMAGKLEALLKPDAAPPEDPLEAAGIDAKVRAVFTEYEEHRLRENLKRGQGLWKVRAAFSLEDFDTRLAELNGVLKPLGEVISTLPSSQPGDDQTIAFDLIFGSSKPLDEIVRAVGQRASVEALTKRPYAVPPSAPRAPRASRPSAPRLPPPVPSAVPPPVAWPAPSTPTPLPSTPSSSSGEHVAPRVGAQTVRVDIARLDRLMNSIGELLVIRGNVTRLAEAARQPGVVAVQRLWAQSLEREAKALERKLDELQKGLLEVRMVPLGQVFDKLARLMRRLVRESGKSVEFQVAGGDVELDKLIVDELSDPLMHLLRNALDHGVELPEQRSAQGKTAQARITLRAQQEGNHVVLRVADDGAGMDEVRIQRVAIERGLITPAQADELDRRELLNLVFLPGFSTRTNVSELSGRGVGLDVVKTNLARLSGLIDIQSTRGQGTSFVLTLPLTLAIIRALMVRAGQETYAVPLNAVLEIVSVRPEELRTIERREVMQVRGQTLPFVRLSRLFGHPDVAAERYFVIIVGLAQQRVGVAVEALEGQQDIVTKPLGGRLKDVRGVAGATELADRRAVLVLDVATLIEDLLRPQVTGLEVVR